MIRIMKKGVETGRKRAVLVAIEPRCYREAIGFSVWTLRPHLEVVIVEPEALGEEISRLDPAIVLASCANTFTPNGKPSWVDYRPYADPTGAEGMISVGGEAARPVEGIEIADLLSIVDRAIPS
jgi:hypothetical protein